MCLVLALTLGTVAIVIAPELSSNIRQWILGDSALLINFFSCISCNSQERGRTSRAAALRAYTSLSVLDKAILTGRRRRRCENRTSRKERGTHAKRTRKEEGKGSLEAPWSWSNPWVNPPFHRSPTRAQQHHQPKAYSSSSSHIFVSLFSSYAHNRIL